MKHWLKEHIDLSILLIVSCLLMISILSIYSATYDTGSQVYFHRQIMFAVIGFLLMLAILAMPFRTL